jgi:hypothetical protein
VVDLLDGRKPNADLSFMDGPYVVHVFAKRRDSWQGEFVERRFAGTVVMHAPHRSLLECSHLA